MQLTIIAAIAMAIAGVFFALQNNVPVTVNFIVWRFDGSLAMVLLLAVALGAAIVALLTTPATLRQQWIASRQKRRIEGLEQDNKKLAERMAELKASRTAPEEAKPSEPPYVGLKQLMMSNDSTKGADERNTDA